ncbi:MAG: fused MFS/spermidine synthase [Saprospiraceae bacterium]
MIPWWKRWLSYLFEIHVESRSSEYNPHLYVSIRNGRYQLSTAHAIYSYGDLYSNFAKLFHQWDWETQPVEDVLVLGLGLGSIPVIIEETHQRICHYTAVEIDEEVVDLAWQYVLCELESPVEMITADASMAVYMLPEESYDLICVDIFDDDKVPAIFESVDFLEQTATLLRPGGVLVFNRLAANEGDKNESLSFLKRLSQRRSPKVSMWMWEAI